MADIDQADRTACVSALRNLEIKSKNITKAALIVNGKPFVGVSGKVFYRSAKVALRQFVHHVLRHDVNVSQRMSLSDKEDILYNICVEVLEDPSNNILTELKLKI